MVSVSVSVSAGALGGASGCARPLAVQVLSETTRLERSQPSPEHSSVFDGKVVRLRGARGETLGLELRISDGKERSAELLLPESAAVVTGFSVRSLVVREPSTSLYGKGTGAGTYPDVLVPEKGALRSNDLAYFDVAIPRDAKPGHYEGDLRLGDRAIPVVLDVNHARIDLAKNPLVWVFYSPSEIARAANLPDGDGPALIEKEAEYDALFRAHGAYLASDLSPARFAPRRRFVHDVSYWPVAIDTTSDDAIERDVRSWLALFRDTGVTPFAIPVDEPHSASQKDRARHVAEIVGSAGGGRPWLLRGVTDTASPVYGDAIDVFFSPKNIPATKRAREASGERFWTYNGRPPEAGSMILDTDGAALRTWGWIAERYDIDLWYAWEGVYFSDRYNSGGPKNPERDPISFDERRHGGTDWGNGDGVLAYPGALASLRLKVLRRGLEDRLLLRELEACGATAVAADIVRRTVPNALGEAGDDPSWPATETGWERALGEVLDAIEAWCHEGA